MGFLCESRKRQKKSLVLISISPLVWLSKKKTVSIFLSVLPWFPPKMRLTLHTVAFLLWVFHIRGPVLTADCSAVRMVQLYWLLTAQQYVWYNTACFLKSSAAVRMVQLYWLLTAQQYVWYNTACFLKKQKSLLLWIWEPVRTTVQPETKQDYNAGEQHANVPKPETTQQRRGARRSIESGCLI